MSRVFDFNDPEDRQLVADLIQNEGVDYYFNDYENPQAFTNAPQVHDAIDRYLNARQDVLDGLRELGVPLDEWL